jgi:hypothetical protein
MRREDQAWFARPAEEYFPFLSQETERLRRYPYTLETLTATASAAGLILADWQEPFQQVLIQITHTLRDINFVRAGEEGFSALFREACGDIRYHDLWTAEDGPYHSLRPLPINDLQSLMSIARRPPSPDQAGSSSNAPAHPAVPMDERLNVHDSGSRDLALIRPVPLTVVTAQEMTTDAWPPRVHSATATPDSEMRYAMFSTFVDIENKALTNNTTRMQ